MEKEVYNLEFPPYIEELNIGGYLFKRLPKEQYEEAFNGLPHLVNSQGSEFSTKVQTGSHQITGYVVIPETEEPAKLGWGDPNATKLHDCLLLLTLFTGRNVFTKDWESEGVSIIADHRMHQWGQQLHLSIGEWQRTFKDPETGKIVSVQEIEEQGLKEYDFEAVNIAIERDINRVFNLISTDEWQNKWQGGYFIFLFRDAVQRQILEKSFLTCWTIWEQIFSIENSQWLPEEDIFKTGGDKKIGYVLNKYFSVELTRKARKNISRLTKSRNRLIHFGKKMDNVSNEEKDMFIRLTEQLIAITFSLEPNNVFNSLEKLDTFLNS